MSCGSEPAPGTLECGTNLATDEELALTPRDDTNLEHMAIAATRRVVAGQEQYERIVRDVGAIRAMRPDLAAIDFLTDYAHEIIVRADEGTIARMLAGEYDPWDCLNERFRLKDLAFGPSTPDRVDLVFEGTYHTPTLAERYARLPGVQSATAGLRVGDGSTLCVTPGDDNWHYVVDQGTGDCVAGCTDHDYSYFISKADGTIVPSGTWAERSTDPRPPWFDAYVNDRACHGVM